MKKIILRFFIICFFISFFTACHHQDSPTQTQIYRREFVENKTGMISELLLNEQMADSLYSNGIIDTTLMRHYIKTAMTFAKKYPQENITPEILLKSGCYCIIMATTAKDDWNIVALSKEAIAIFDQLEKIYPDYEKVKLCYLYRGKIYDDVLHDYDNAQIEYNNFILKYPNDSLTKGIQDYVDNILGKNLNEVVNRFEMQNLEKSKKSH